MVDYVGDGVFFVGGGWVVVFEGIGGECFDLFGEVVWIEDGCLGVVGCGVGSS